MKVIISIIKVLVKFWEQISSKWIYFKDYISSIVFNWTYLPPEQAKIMPIWVHKLHFAKWSKFTGKIIIDSDNIYPKMIRLGVLYNSWYPDSGITIQNYGTIVFKGECIIGNDTTFFLKEGAVITIGKNFSSTAHGQFISENNITIGDDTRFGWNVALLDTNFHYMTNVNDGTTNMKITAPIFIGNHNWLGNGVSVTKGFETADYVTIGAGSRCRGKIKEKYTVWASDNKLVRLSEGWYRDLSKDQNIYEVIR